MNQRRARTGGTAPLQTVDRAIDVLLSFDEHRTEWGVTELAEEFGWDKSVAQRLLATLACRGFLVSDRMARRTGYTAIFAVPDGVHLRCVEAIDGETGPVRFYPLVGELYPAHAGATSRAYFAMLPEPARATLFRGRPMARFSDTTPTDVDGLEHSFRITRATGYAYSEGEYDVATAALAIPVVVRHRPVGTLSLLARSQIPEETRAELVDLLVG